MHQEFGGALTERDHKSHIVHAFEVPPGATRLSLRLRYAPQRVGRYNNMLCLTLLDPAGFRGSGHRHGAEHVVVVGPDAATPGYLAGPIPAGSWSAVIHTHMVMPGEPCRYTLEVATSDGPAPAPAEQPPAAPIRRLGPGWYRGDLHAHTLHSDADWDTAGLLAAARERGLDFATITDHNTTAHLAGIDGLSSDELLVMGGMELTTFWGHALSLGTRAWVDWRASPGRTMRRIAAEVAEMGGLFVIAHPRAPGDPECTGCDWRYVEMMPGTARAVEVWNGPWLGESNNEEALALFYRWLDEGHRLVATAGTDAHGPAPAEVRPGFSVVYAEERSERAILAAVARGRLYLSSGPRLTIAASGPGGAAAMGEALDGPARVAVTWSECPPGGVVRLVAGGAALLAEESGPAGERAVELPAGSARWCAAELRAEGGELLALTNPIFFGEGA